MLVRALWNSLFALTLTLLFIAATQVHSSLLSISVGAVLLPAAYHFSISGGSDAASFEQRLDILQMSHGVRHLSSLSQVRVHHGSMCLNRSPLSSS